MLKHLTVDKVHEIIDAAKELNARHSQSKGVRLSEVSAADLAAYNNDAKKLEQVIAALGDDALAELMALMEIGRDLFNDDFEGTFDKAVAQARRESEGADVDAAYIAEKSLALPTYLANGLKKIGVGPRRRPNY